MNLFESLLKENKKISKEEKKSIKEDVGINDTLVGQEWRTYKDSPNYEENELFETDPVNSDFEKLNDEPIEIEYVADEHDESRDFVPSFWFENRRHYLDDYVRVHDNPWFSSYDNFPNYIHGIEGDVYSHPLFIELIDGEYVNVYRENERRTESKKAVKESTDSSVIIIDGYEFPKVDVKGKGIARWYSTQNPWMDAIFLVDPKNVDEANKLANSAMDSWWDDDEGLGYGDAIELALKDAGIDFKSVYHDSDDESDEYEEAWEKYLDTLYNPSLKESKKVKESIESNTREFMSYHENPHQYNIPLDMFNVIYEILDKYGDEDDVEILFRRASEEDQQKILSLLRHQSLKRSFKFDESKNRKKVKEAVDGKDEVCIIIKGGMVQEVFSTRDDIDASVIDLDVEYDSDLYDDVIHRFNRIY